MDLLISVMQGIARALFTFGGCRGILILLGLFVVLVIALIWVVTRPA